jgi:hypothetical protein
MFRVISIAVFVLAVMWAILQVRGNPHKLNGRSMLRVLRTTDFHPQNLRNIHILRKAIFVATTLSLAILAISGFLPKVIFGAHLSGVALLIHVTVAPIFALLLAILIVLAAHRHRFVQDDLPGLRYFFRREKNYRKSTPSPVPSTPQKICFWLAAILSLPLILSILFSMSGLFDAKYQAWFLNTHRYSSLGFLVVVLWHTGSLLPGDATEARDAVKQPSVQRRESNEPNCNR